MNPSPRLRGRVASFPSLAVLFVVAACLATPGLAGPPDAPEPPPPPPKAMHGGPGHAHGPGPLLRALHRLDLDETQRDALRAILDARREPARAQAEAIHEAREALERAVHADVLDEAAIRVAASDLAALEADRAVDRAALLQEVRTVLTAEQWAQLETMRERRTERLVERRERRSRAPRAGRQPRPPRQPDDDR